MTELGDFGARIAAEGRGPLRRRSVRTLQVNLTRRCNLACHHCHVESGPKRTEALPQQGAERVLFLLERNPQVATLDLTGGAPELSPWFRPLVRGARALGREVIDRCNLTVFDESGQEDTPEFLAAEGVRVIASLPCYTRENVDRQRGKGVFGRSIEALLRLNALGYGKGGPLQLDLVYNPQGTSLPPEQGALEAEYRVGLREDFGIAFDRLLTITNVPIARFAHDLARAGQDAYYQRRLEESFNLATVDALMCRDLLSVSWDGRLYDCDFHLAVGLDPPAGARTIFEVEDLDAFAGSAIRTAPHCFACTAGAGSSCGGALLEGSA